MNFFLHAIIYKYLISLLIITSIESYLSSIARFVDLGNLIIKFIVTLSHNNLDRRLLILDFAIARMCIMFVLLTTKISFNVYLDNLSYLRKLTMLA